MANHVLKLGQRAPAFSLKADDGALHRLTELRGQWVVVYFYPKAMTPGCTAQACDFRNSLREFQRSGAGLLGLSPDPAESLARFRAAHKLNFPLLADRDCKIATKYGVWREKQNYGRSYLGIVRSTFLVDPAGKIAAAWDNVRVKGHTAKVLARLREEVQS